MTERDPLALLAAQEVDRLAALVPVRRQRMAASPLAFLRGAAVVMAHDLRGVPTSGVTTQLCGDAHLLNFGFHATPGRRLVFAIEDPDETAVGPWEWDVLRLAASVAVAAEVVGAGRRRTQEAIEVTAGTYAERVAELRAVSRLDAWFATGGEGSRRSLHLARTLHESGLGATEASLPNGAEIDGTAVASYLATLSDDRDALLAGYRLDTVAAMVVGIGSVGLRCYSIRLRASADDTITLEAKEAVASAIAPPAVADGHQGERVVRGQRLLQPDADPLLGWFSAAGRDYHVRQLHDFRFQVRLDDLRPRDLVAYSRVCASTLATAHCRTGAAAAIADALARDAGFVGDVASFARGYAEQTARDHAALVAALREAL